MKLRTYRLNHPNGQEKGWEFYCPACQQLHRFRTKPVGGLDHEGKPWPRWTFDGNTAAPTFTPSLLYTSSAGRWVDGKWAPRGPRRTVCHLHLRAGVIQFCPDNPHSLNGQRVPLPDIPEGL